MGIRKNSQKDRTTAPKRVIMYFKSTLTQRSVVHKYTSFWRNLQEIGSKKIDGNHLALCIRVHQYNHGCDIQHRVPWKNSWHGRTQQQASYQYISFLHNDQKDASPLEKAMKQLVIRIIYEEAERSGKPIFCIVDDTIVSKTKPSSKAMHPMESANFHFSHLERKQDYGH